MAESSGIKYNTKTINSLKKVQLESNKSNEDRLHLKKKPIERVASLIPDEQDVLAAKKLRLEKRIMAEKESLSGFIPLEEGVWIIF